MATGKQRVARFSKSQIAAMAVRDYLPAEQAKAVQCQRKGRKADVDVHVGIIVRRTESVITMATDSRTQAAKY
jgi:hypothetical protein